jgi:hypothetical protein
MKGVPSMHANSVMLAPGGKGLCLYPNQKMDENKAPVNNPKSSEEVVSMLAPFYACQRSKYAAIVLQNS